jgi:hypothetical protein
VLAAVMIAIVVVVIIIIKNNSNSNIPATAPWLLVITPKLLTGKPRDTHCQITS